MNRVIRTTCAYCGVGCGIRAEVAGEREVRIAGDTEHPANYGRLCSKGTHLGETVGLEGRLLHPIIGDRQAGWNEALDLVASRLRETIAAHGPDSVAFYVSGQLLTEDYYVANKLMKGFIGSANIDTNSRLCMASAVAAHNRAFGEDVVPCTYNDIDEADLILLVGSNTAWCHPVVWQRIEQARAKRGTMVVVVDPRRTETAAAADLHVAVMPDSDVALFNGLLAEMKRRDLLDHEFLRDRCTVPDGFWNELGGSLSDPGVDSETFSALCDLVADHPRMVTLFSQGANQSRSGSDKGNAIINLHLALGRINAPGMGPFSITGQPNAMGGREVGGLANMLACHLGFSPEERADVAAFWNAPNLCTQPGLKAVDLFRAIHDGKVRFLWVMATNPAVSMPDAAFVREALARCETVVVSDVMADTDTGRFAHVRLPALAWGEKDGTVTNSERTVSRQRALFPAPGSARADWRIVCDVAQRMGWGDAFAFAGPAAIFREYAAMTALAPDHGKRLDLAARSGLDDAAYDSLVPFRWGGAHPLSRGFSTADGKARLVGVTPRHRDADPTFPLRLNTTRYRDQWHTMTRTGLSPTLSQHRREPLVEVHPQVAAGEGLVDGGLAKVQTRRGSGIFRVSVTDAQAPGTIAIPMHWADTFASGGRANLLTRQDVDSISGQPGFKDTPAALIAFNPEWRAFLVVRDPLPVPRSAWWCLSRVRGGMLYELSGTDEPGLVELLPPGEKAEATDVTRGMNRVIVRDHSGQLIAALYLTRTGSLPHRDWIIRQLSETGAGLPELLAGRPRTVEPDRGAITCVCLGIGANEIRAAAFQGVCSVAGIGRATGAGTNCGSCRTAIATILDSTIESQKEAAE